MEQTRAVLQQFLLRFNRPRFRVPPRCPDTAFRTLSPELRLEQVLCFKHRRRVARDNTVKFQRHTLQLLPGPKRRSYAGAVVVVLEGLDGRLRYSMKGASLLPRKRRSVRGFSAAPNGTSPSAPYPDIRLRGLS